MKTNLCSSERTQQAKAPRNVNVPPAKRRGKNQQCCHMQQQRQQQQQQQHGNDTQRIMLQPNAWMFSPAGVRGITAKCNHLKTRTSRTDKTAAPDQQREVQGVVHAELLHAASSPSHWASRPTSSRGHSQVAAALHVLDLDVVLAPSLKFKSRTLSS